MSSFNKDSLIPVASLLLGIGLTCLTFAWLRQPLPEIEAAREQFDALQENEQANVRNIAGAHLKDEKYRQRIEAIHATVQDDPALLQKLEDLQRLLKKQDRRTLETLQPEGEFSEQWAKLVEEIRQRDAQSIPIIYARIPGPDQGRISIPESSVDDFLSAILPDSIPEELQTRLKALSLPDQQVERTLAKLIWVLQQVRSGDHTDEHVSDILSTAAKYLISPELESAMAERIKEGPATADQLPSIKRWMAHFLLTQSVLRHYADQFHERHVLGQCDSAKVFSRQLERNRQLTLMKMDPADAANQLDRDIFAQGKVNDPVIEELNRDLKDTLARLSRGGWNGPWRGRSGRGRFGDGRTGSSSRKSPTGDRGRPPGGRAPDGDRRSRSGDIRPEVKP